MLIILLLPLYFAMLVFLHAGAAKFSAFAIRRITLPWRKAAILGLICVLIQFSSFIFGAGGMFVALVVPPFGTAWFLSSQTLTRLGEPVTFGLGLIKTRPWKVSWMSVLNDGILTMIKLIDVSDQQDRGICHFCHSHIDNVAVLEIDFGRAARTFDPG